MDSTSDLQAYEDKALTQTQFVSHVQGKALVDKKAKVSGLKKKAPLIAVLILLIALPIVIFSTTALYPFHFVANVTSKVMTFISTVKEKVLYVIDEYLSGGKMPEQLVEDLEAEGVEVGAVTSTGEFIKTDRVIAEGAEYTVAASDGTKFRVESGVLSLRFMGKVISAGDFVSQAKSDYALYNAVMDAIGGDAGIFHDRAGNEAFDELGINRNPYAEFVETGDAAEDQRKFEEMYAELLDYTVTVQSGAQEACLNILVDPKTGETKCDPNETDEDTETDGAVGGDKTASSAEEYIDEVAGKARANSKDKANNNAAALLNAAVSANEPVQAGKAAAGIIIAVEQAKAGDNGPINQAANLMMAEADSTYSDPTSGQEQTTRKSPAEAANMSAVTAGGSFSQETASRYSRDRVASLVANGDTGSAASSTSKALVSSESKLKQFVSWIGGLFKGRAKADPEEIKAKASNSLTDALYSDASKVATGEALGEKIIEGSAYINAVMARNVGGASASDEAAIAQYAKDVQAIVAYDKEADVARRSPFDISSPNTFLGSIVNSLYPVMAQKSSLTSKLSGVANTASSSLARVVGGQVYADGDEESYATSYGNCTALTSVGGKGDLYCNENPTFDMSTINMTLSQLEGQLGDQLEGGEVKENGSLEQYLAFSTKRTPTPGPKSAQICQILSKGNPGGNSLWSRIKAKIMGTTEELERNCTGDNEKIATGEAYANSPKNPYWDGVKYYQAYVLETYVLELTGYYKDSKNPTVAALESFYERNPKDTSYAGVIAERTGLSKEEVIAGIEGIVYLAYLDSYDPATRYAFMEMPAEPEFEPESVAISDGMLIDERRKFYI